MSDDSQDFFVGHLARVDGSDAGSIASLSSGDEMSQYGLFDEDIFLPFPAQDTSVFDEPHSIPEAVRSLAYNHAIWEPLEQDATDYVTKTLVAHPYPHREAGCVVVKKSCFPPKDVYLYHSQKLSFNVQIGNKFYFCVASPEQAGFVKLHEPSLDAVALQLERKHLRFFVLNSSGLYRVIMTRGLVLSICANPTQLSAIDQVMSRDLCMLTQSLFKLTSQAMSQIQQICPSFCQGFDPTPRVNNQKPRNARLLSHFYPDLPVYAVDERTLMMPYFDQPVTVEEIIQEAIRIFLIYRRIVADMGLVNHFKKDQNGKVYCTETAVTFSVRKRVSKGSLFIGRNIVNARSEVGQCTPYQKFLATVHQRSAEESKLVQITLGLLYLAETIHDCDDIDNDWVNADWLTLVYRFSITRFPLELSDLELMHTFGPLLRQICLNSQPQSETGYRIYYRCIEYFIQQKDSEHLRRFLHALAVETVEQVLNSEPPSLLSTAVLANDLESVQILLEFDADPLQEDANEAYNAIDWALFHGYWEGLTNLLNAEKRAATPTVNSYIFWTSSSPKTQVATQDAVTAMRVLAEATQFQVRLKTIKNLALGEQSHAYLTLVHSLLRTCKAYFENKEEALADRKKLFIQNCNRLLRQPLPALSSELATNTMQTAIRELKNALSLARDPTFYCMIS